MRLQDQKGLTLIEILVVMAIIGIMVGFSVPMFAAWKADQELTAETDDLALSIRRMQQLSLRKSMADATNRVSITIESGGYHIITDNTTSPPTTQTYTAFRQGISIFPGNISLAFDPYTLNNNAPVILTLSHSGTTKVSSIVIARETGRIRIDTSANPSYRTEEQ